MSRLPQQSNSTDINQMCKNMEQLTALCAKLREGVIQRDREIVQLQQESGQANELIRRQQAQLRQDATVLKLHRSSRRKKPSAAKLKAYL